MNMNNRPDPNNIGDAGGNQTQFESDRRFGANTPSRLNPADAYRNDPAGNHNQSPSVMVQSNRQQLDITENNNSSGAPLSNQIHRNHQVNHSFGQQPFRNMNSSRVDDSSRDQNNSMRMIGGGNTSQRTNQTGHLAGEAGAAQYQSRQRSLDSGVGATNDSKGEAISMTSVMGNFEPVDRNGVPNIFQQSIQQQQMHHIQNQQSKDVQGQPRPSKNSKSKKASLTSKKNASMTSTQQNFASTVNRIQTTEQLVQDGLSRGAERRSQHSLEAERMGLRKSQEGQYEEIKKPQNTTSSPARNKQGADTFIKNLVDQASFKVQQAAMDASFVPQEIRDQLIQQGFRPSSQADGQFEYDSDAIEKYEMISNEFDYEIVRQGPDFGLKQYKDCIYRGQLNKITRQREGLGVLVYTNGRVYEGEWYKNKRHGRGYEHFSNGNTYHGSHEQGKANGKGVYQWKNGEVYDGEWFNGIKNGYGVWKGSNGESYIGQWVMSKAQGFGVHVFANGDKYEGEWFQCLRQGNGSDFFVNGDCYVGQYNQGKPEGFGQYKWQNGSSYTGQFVNGLKHGHGKWKKRQADELGNNSKCNQYEGMYENDKKNGHGVFDWESGNRYVGNYKDDERDGYGVMKWTDESQYMGVWDQGIQHGVGVMVFPDGVKRAGTFEENVFSEGLKRKDQIDPYREVLAEDCLQILEEIVYQKEQKLASLYGPIDKSKAEVLEREKKNAELGIHPQETMQKHNTEPDFSTLPTSNINRNIASGQGSVQIMNSAADIVSENLSNFEQMRVASKEDLHQTMQKVKPMKESLFQSNQKRNRSKESIAIVDQKAPIKVASPQRSSVGKKFLKKVPVNKPVSQIVVRKSKELSQRNSSVQSINKEVDKNLKVNERRPVAKNDSIMHDSMADIQHDRNVQSKDYDDLMNVAQPQKIDAVTNTNKEDFQAQKEAAEAETLALQKVPATSVTLKEPNPGRTIEVQTDLSMLTMEQYSQGYNSKAFMNKTQGFDKKKLDSTVDNASVTSPNIKYQNDLNQSTKDFSNVLSKPQFQDKKLQMEILGGGNPNEDTESEWNRNNSSMMVRKSNMMNGTKGSVQPQKTKPKVARTNDLKNQLASQQRKAQQQLASKKSSLAGSHPTRSQQISKKNNLAAVGGAGGNSHPAAPRRIIQRSNDVPSLPPSRSRQHMIETMASPYTNINRSIDEDGLHYQQQILQTDPRENVFAEADRSLIQNRHGQRLERSLPNQTTNHLRGGDLSNMGYPNKQQNRQINRLNLIQQENLKRPPQKMFQSQYGGQRFIQNMIQQDQRQAAPLPPPAEMFRQQQNQQSAMMEYPLMDSPPYNQYRRDHHQQQQYQTQMPLSIQNMLPKISSMTETNNDTPVVHQNMKRNFPNNVDITRNQPYARNAVGVFNTYEQPLESRREDILTPSPKMERTSQPSNHYNPNFNKSVGQQAFQFSQPLYRKPEQSPPQNMSNFSEAHSGIAVNSMYGNEYGQKPLITAQQQQQQAQQQSFIERTRGNSLTNSVDYRGKTSTSSQQTLRYNDFELVQKLAENDPAYAVDLDEGDGQESHHRIEELEQQKAVHQQYPDIQQKQSEQPYESNQSYKNEQQLRVPGPFQKNSRNSLPKMASNQSVQKQDVGSLKRQHLNSNDTQLASHTINLNASQEMNRIDEYDRLPNQRLVQRSLPPAKTSKISVKQGIQMINPSEIQLQRRINFKKNVTPKPTTKFITKSKRSLNRLDASNSNSQGRSNFVGPYAQNLKKPKLFEARGTQKIALKNHQANLQQQQQNSHTLAQRQMQNGSRYPFNNDVFQNQKNSLTQIDGGHAVIEEEQYTDDQRHVGNYVIQHQSLIPPQFDADDLLPPVRNQQMQSLQHNQKNKRVWVPYNKKRQLKGLQQNMMQGNQRLRPSASQFSSNPLLNSQ